MTYLNHSLRWLGLLLLATTGILACSSESESHAKKDLPPDVHAVTGLEIDSPDTELRPLDAAIGQASFVGLGESIHTSGGFYRAKFRLFKYLVENHRFRAFAFETPWQAAQVIARYVDTCEGNPSEVTRQGLFGVFAAGETQAIFEWMCSWNQAHPQDKVIFYGFDTQQPEADAPALRDFLNQKAGDQATTLIDGFSTCAPERPSDRSPIQRTAQGHEDCLAGLERVSGWLEDHADGAAPIPARDVAYARMRIVGLRAWELQVYHATQRDVVTGGKPNGPLSYEGRDRGMATIVRSMRDLEAPGKRVAIWAHNSHISESGALSMDRTRSMGSFLRTELGADYAAIGIIGYDVSIDWYATGRTYTGPAGSLERRLHDLGHPFLILDTNANGNPEALLKPGEKVKFYNSAATREMIPAEQFTALFYLDVSPMMTRIR